MLMKHSLPSMGLVVRRLMQTSASIGESRMVKKFAIETYGCQMNFNDSEIVNSILNHTGRFAYVPSTEKAEIVLLMTCAIRENAEEKIRHRIRAIKSSSKAKPDGIVVGVLGCMAERIKMKLIDEEKVDVVCGPDAYRDLPRLLENASSENPQDRINTLLSLEETYADIAPVRLDENKKSAFVSIMRGCNNMCTYCIVPFTRGRERSRSLQTIVEEVGLLVDQGVKEVTLLGQNVNSYCDTSEIVGRNTVDISELPMSQGFKTVYKTTNQGRRFHELLDSLSSKYESVRFRFTSPHPKDFPDPLLWLIRDRKNICKQIHLPAQSGSNPVLERMRRGYTRESYLELVEHIREIIPNVALSSDFIVGFSGETEDDFNLTMDLMKTVQYDMAYMYAYSVREGTTAHRRYPDDIPPEVKQRRLRTLIDYFYDMAKQKLACLMGRSETVLIESSSKKDETFWMGRTDSGHPVVFPKLTLPNEVGNLQDPQVGDLVRVEISGLKGVTAIGIPKSMARI